MKKALPHTLALITIVIWSSTFVVTKYLLEYFSPTAILIYRFFISIILLFIIYPKFHKPQKLTHELYFLGAGLSGITGYFLLQNIALSYTSATNVGIISGIVPIVTLLSSFIAFKKPKISWNFVLGFFIAISGIILITLNGAFELKLNPLGDILAILAMVSWGIYGVFLKLLTDLGYQGTTMTRHIMEYGFIFLIPAFFITKSSFNFNAFTDYKVVLSLLFLALFASTLAFLLWNYSCQRISTVTTNIYLYLSPLISTLFSFIFLKEKITLFIIIGMILSIIGLLVSSNFTINFIKKLFNFNKNNIDEEKGSD